jgi:hypothetical protein
MIRWVCGVVRKKIGNPYESLCVFVDLMDILLSWRNNSVKNPQTLFICKLLYTSAAQLRNKLIFSLSELVDKLVYNCNHNG